VQRILGTAHRGWKERALTREGGIRITRRIVQIWTMARGGESLKSRLAHGVTWSTAGSIVSQGSSLVTAILVARLVGVGAFGQFVLIQSTALMLQAVGGLGLGVATTRLVARLRSHDAPRSGRVIGFALLFTLVSGIVLACLVLATPMAILRATLHMDTLDGTMRLVGVIACWGMLNRIYADVLIGLEAFARMARAHFVRGVLTLSLASFGAGIFGLPGAVVALAVASFTSCVVFHIMVRSECRNRGIHITFRGIRREVGMLSTSLCVTGSNVTLALVAWILCVSLARQANGLAEVAVFNAADRWRAAILFLPGLLAQVSLPLLAHTHAHGRRRDYHLLLLGASCTGLVVVAIPTVILILLAPVVMAGFGDAFVQGKPVLVLLAIACLPISVYMVGSYGLCAAGRAGAMLAVDIARASIALSYCLLRTSFTAYDVAVATLLSYLVATPLIGLMHWRVGAGKAMDERFQGAVVGAGSA